MAVKTDAQLARLSAIKADPSLPEAVAEIEKALRGKSTVVAARAAEIVGNAKLENLESALLEAFARFMSEADKGCIAKTAIARALLEIESRAEFDPEMRKLLATSIALTRQPAAIEFLLLRAAQDDSKVAAMAIEALAIYRSDDAMRAKLAEIAQKRGGDVLVAFERAFASR